jgi:hypothetical protein
LEKEKEVSMFFGRSHPISPLWLTRGLIGVIVLLALATGYLFNENKRLTAVCAGEEITRGK